MRYKPILFNTEMVKAILEGRKTQTRRIIKPQPTNPRWNNIGWLGWDDGHGYHMKPPCEPGDVLWVREAWCDPAPDVGYSPILYKADFPMHWDADQTEHGEPVDITADEYKWHPSIHMPKEAARIFLRVKDVRVERLRDIHEKYEPGPDNPVPKEGFRYLCDFIAVWENTIQPKERSDFGWAANPWVWVIEFERCDKPEEWCRDAY